VILLPIWQATSNDVLKDKLIPIDFVAKKRLKMLFMEKAAESQLVLFRSKTSACVVNILTYS